MNEQRNDPRNEPRNERRKETSKKIMSEPRMGGTNEQRNK